LPKFTERVQVSDHSNNDPNFVPLIVGSLVFVVFIIVMAYIVVGNTQKPIDPAAIDTRIQPVAKLELAAADAAPAGARTGEQLFQAACQACHATGAAGAPKVGDKAAWAPRLGQGLKGLLASSMNGKNAMPPKGGSGDATEAELARAIVYMANQSGASFAEPK
jgi:cytochrome c5